VLWRLRLPGGEDGYEFSMPIDQAAMSVGDQWGLSRGPASTVRNSLGPRRCITAGCRASFMVWVCTLLARLASRSPQSPLAAPWPGLRRRWHHSRVRGP
jgi:hypothetical protein